MSLRHSGHSRVGGLGSSEGSTFSRRISAVSGTTTAKKTTVATMRNESTALRNDPYLNCEWLSVKVRLEKLGFPKMAAMSGVIRSATNAVIIAVKATPTTTATARSTTLPRSTNFLKSESMQSSLLASRVTGDAPVSLSVFYSPPCTHSAPTCTAGHAERGWGGRRELETGSPRQESNPRHLHYK